VNKNRIRYANYISILTVLLITISASATSVDDELIEFTPVMEGLPYYSQKESLEKLVTNEDDWKDVWEDIYSGSSFQPTIPDINFMEKDLVAIFLGERRNGGYHVQIDKIRFLEEGTSKDLKISYHEDVPGKDCFVPAVLTYPGLVVSIPKLQIGNVTFTKTVFEVTCGDPKTSTPINAVVNNETIPANVIIETVPGFGPMITVIPLSCLMLTIRQMSSKPR